MLWSINCSNVAELYVAVDPAVEGGGTGFGAIAAWTMGVQSMDRSTGDIKCIFAVSQLREKNLRGGTYFDA